MVLQGVLNAQNETVQSKMTFNINDLYKLFEPDIKNHIKDIYTRPVDSLCFSLYINNLIYCKR